MANSSNKKLVPEAMTALDKFKYEVASENKKLVPEAMTALDKFKYEVASDVAVKNIF